MERQGSPRTAQAGKGYIRGPAGKLGQQGRCVMMSHFSILIDLSQIGSSNFFPRPPWHVGGASTVKPSVLNSR